MELTYDWRGFQALFYPHRRASHSRGASGSSPIYVVVDGNTVVSAFADHEDLTDWVGASYDEVAGHTLHRELLAFSRDDVDRWMDGALGMKQFYEQVEQLRAGAVPRAAASTAPGQSPTALPAKFSRNFMLEAIHGWWEKVLPSAYGVYVRVEGSQEQSFFLLVRKGRLESFHEPDLTTIGKDRRQRPGEVVRYLSEKYLVPVQGIFVNEQDWSDWLQSSTPWRQIALAVRSNRAKLVPFRWGAASLLVSRAFFGV